MCYRNILATFMRRFWKQYNSVIYRLYTNRTHLSMIIKLMVSNGNEKINSMLMKYSEPEKTTGPSGVDSSM
jgi:hypothetical protein